jgi:hypothetical protein
MLFRIWIICILVGINEIEPVLHCVQTFTLGHTARPQLPTRQGGLTRTCSHKTRSGNAALVLGNAQITFIYYNIVQGYKKS